MYNSVSGDVRKKLLDKFKWCYSLNSKYLVTVQAFLIFELELLSTEGVILLKVHQTPSVCA
jgi:hypothetical protein